MTPQELTDSYHTLVLELRNAVNVLGIFVADLEKLEAQIKVLDSTPTAPDPHWLEYPLDYRPIRITGEYGIKNEFYTWTHEGIDISVPVGWPVHACADGKVIFVGPNRGYGNFIKIEHEHMAEKWWTGYAHLSGTTIMIWTRLKAGDTIGLTGASGNVTAPHLHLNVQRASSTFKPDTWLETLRGCINPRDWLKDLP